MEEINIKITKEELTLFFIAVSERYQQAERKKEEIERSARDFIASFHA